MPDVRDLRRAVVAEAASWLRTPYHHMGRVKGGGVDCLMLLAEVYEAAGVIPHVEIPFYPPDWHLHRGVERYLEGLMHTPARPAGRRNPATRHCSDSGAALRMGRLSPSGRG
jgi:cell wall-associated NlpC family hydrolase